MIRNRSNLVLLLYYIQIPHFYNSYSTLLILVKRRYIWLRIYRIAWRNIWILLSSYILMVQKIKKTLKLILLNMYSLINYSYFYFYNNNQFLLIYVPYFALFMHFNYINIYLLKWNSFYIIQFLYNNLLLNPVNDLLFNSFISWKILRLNNFQLLNFFLIFYNYYELMANFLFFPRLKQNLKYQLLMNDTEIEVAGIQLSSNYNWYLISYQLLLSILVTIYNYCIYLIYYYIITMVEVN
uniref:Uncharacterized protein n=1 Tax=Euplotes aediculatus TaxID=5940 RepID=A0A8A9WN48_EUPAE|nr:hypothetical protein [Euplotes aediculatus]